MFYLLLVVLTFFAYPNQEGKLEVVGTAEPDVFNIIYKGDMKWNVEVTLYNEAGKKRFAQEIGDTDGFILPIRLSNEKSGTFRVEIFTPVYDLQQEFTYLSAADKLATLLDVRFNSERRSITLSSEELIDMPFNVYILNEEGDELVHDNIDPLGGKLVRIYNLQGAPGNQLQFVILVEGNQIIREVFE